eukprot:3478766-Amphidinium_carterae.2
MSPRGLERRRLAPLPRALLADVHIIHARNRHTSNFSRVYRDLAIRAFMTAGRPRLRTLLMAYLK